MYAQFLQMAQLCQIVLNFRLAVSPRNLKVPDIENNKQIYNINTKYSIMFLVTSQTASF